MSRLIRFDTVLATRRETSFVKTYSTANTKKAMVPSPGRWVAARMRETRLLLFLKAYSVRLDDSSPSSCSPLRRRKSRLTRGRKEALVGRVC